MGEKKNIKLYLILGILILIVVVIASSVILKNNKKQEIKKPSGMIEEVNITTDDEAEIIEVIKKNVVKIENKLESTSIIGTGFFHKTGYLITNSHIVDIEGEITIEYYNGQKDKAILVSNDISSDVAVLVVEEPKALAMKFANTLELKVTNEVWAVGYPYGFDGEASVSKGILSARRSAGGIEFLQTDMSLNTGFSGGPLVDKNGMLLGINSFATENSTIGMAISAENLETIIEKLIENKKDSYLEGERPENVLGVVLKEIGHETDDLYNEKHITSPEPEKNEESNHVQEENEKESNNTSNNGTANKKEEPFVDLPAFIPEYIPSRLANLKSLNVENYNIQYKDGKNDYTIILKNNEKKLNISAETMDTKATYTIIGNENFKEGENLVIIRVVAEDKESINEYRIRAIQVITKLDRAVGIGAGVQKEYSSTLGVNCFRIFWSYIDSDGISLYPSSLTDLVTKIKVEVYKGWSQDNNGVDIDGKPVTLLKSYEFKPTSLSQTSVDISLNDIRSLLKDEDYIGGSYEGADLTFKVQVVTREQGTFYSARIPELLLK